MSEPSGHEKSHSILVVVGLMMTAVVVLGVTGMLSSIVIAQTNQGMATAVNQSGTLRMQSYRVGVALADAGLPIAQRRQRVRRLVEEYDERLSSPRLLDAIPDSPADPIRRAYEQVRWRWSGEMRHAAMRFVEAGPDASSAAQGRDAFLGSEDDFVDDIHGLVRALEDRSEYRIRLLRWIQAVVLAMTVTAVLVTLVIVQRRVVRPLSEILDCADRVRLGDFSGRTRFTGADELGRVGAAMNLMTQGLSRLYGELEERVAEKTRDLARSTRSLSLLYRTSRALESSAITDELLSKVLEDVRTQVGLDAVALCLEGAAPFLHGRGCISVTDAPSGRDPARAEGCELCTAKDPVGATRSESVLDGRRIISFLVRDQDQGYGMLRVAFPPKQDPESWQQPLLESLAGHLATALSLMGRMHEGRRLALHEERSILARELHDSLAQSLSYLKIQAARLDAALRQSSGPEERGLPPPETILAEIREGISSAYRQLRELLTTFRLRIDGQGLAKALTETVREFRERGDVEITLDDRLPPGFLSPNEEVHVMQIIRESLSNVVRHAEARTCAIRLGSEEDRIWVSITDDGNGLGTQPMGRGHYGMTIMRERALSLGGSIQIETNQGSGGTHVRLSFRPRGLSSVD